MAYQLYPHRDKKKIHKSAHTLRKNTCKTVKILNSKTLSWKNRLRKTFIHTMNKSKTTYKLYDISNIKDYLKKRSTHIGHTFGKEEKKENQHLQK